MRRPHKRIRLNPNDRVIEASQAAFPEVSFVNAVSGSSSK